MTVLDGHDPAAVATAARALRDGRLVAFPTETVYGLGARADDAMAVGRIFAAKGRPADHPLIVHVVDAAATRAFAAPLPDTARRLTARFWPGPLTVIVPRAPGRGEAAAGGQATIGLRSPAHPVARALLQAAAGLGVPGVAAPSANRFGRVSPTTAAHVASAFDAGLIVLDGGACAVGIESTIVDCSRDPPALLRPGSVTRDEVESALGGVLRAQAGPDAPRASGTLEAHYAPRARVRLFDDAASLSDALAALPAGRREAVAVYSSGLAPVPAECRWHPMPADPAAAAHELYAVLRGFDDAGVDHIWVRCPPADTRWEGVLDRLRRAAAS